MIRLFATKGLSQIKNKTLPATHSNGCHYLYSTSSQKQSFALSYLQNSCGLSLESALLASKKLRFDSNENPDKVLSLLGTHGLTHSHIKNLVTRYPGLLSCNLEKALKPNLELFLSLGITGSSLYKMVLKYPGVLEADAKTVVEFFRKNGFSDAKISTLTMKKPVLYASDVHKNLKPKLEYLKSLGLKECEIATTLSSQPYILRRSLENHLIPRIEVLRDAVGNDENLLKVIRRYIPILEYDWGKVLAPSVSFLVNQGVPEPFIWKIFLIHPKVLILGIARLSEIFHKVKKLGFDPTTYKFMLAVRTMGSMGKMRWEEKLNVFRSFNLSDEEIVSAIKLQPMCMLPSEKKLRHIMDFFVNKLSVDPLLITKKPDLLLLSLEKRIMPRCSVLQILISKDLIDDLRLGYMLKMTEKIFIEKMIKKYQDIVPEVVKAHQGKIRFQGFHCAFVL